MVTGNKAACLLYFTLSLIMLQTDLYGAEKNTGQFLPDYRLSVSFDLKNNLLRGKAVITMPEAGVVTIFPGNLTIKSVALNRLPVVYTTKDNVLKIAGNGLLEIRKGHLVVSKLHLSAAKVAEPRASGWDSPC